MLSSLIDGYGSSDSGSDSDTAASGPSPAGRPPVRPEAEPGPALVGEAAAAAPCTQPQPSRRKLPSASELMATTTSWARPENEPPPVRVDSVGTKYHAIPPPVGVRAEDGVMGGRGDYIRPDTTHSLDATKVYAGKRMLSGSGAAGAPSDSAQPTSKPSPGLMVPTHVARGKKNASSEDVESMFSKKLRK